MDLDHPPGPAQADAPEFELLQDLTDTILNAARALVSALQGKMSFVDAWPPIRDLEHNGDAIAHWIEYDSWQPPSQPATTYPQTRDHGASRPAPLSQQTLQRQERSALFYAASRRGGNVILHHRHIRPVLVRDWSPAMDGITATIWASQATGHPKSWTPARPALTAEAARQTLRATENEEMN